MHTESQIFFILIVQWSCLVQLFIDSGVYYSGVYFMHLVALFWLVS